MRKVCLLACCLFAAGCEPTQLWETKTPNAEAAVNELKKDEKLVAPSWYRDRYRSDTPALFGHNQMLKSLFFLSVFIYGFGALVVSLALTDNFNNGDWPYDRVMSRDRSPAEYFFAEGGCLVFIGLLIGVFLVATLLSAIGYAILYFLFGMFNPEGYYIPADFIALLLFALSHIALATFVGAKLKRSFGSRERSTRPSPAAPPVQQGHRSRVVLRAVVRAALVAIATGVGSQVGGWVGGFVVLLLSAAVAAYFGVESPHHDHK